MEPSSPADAPWRSGLQGARANLLPGVVLQAAALALVLGYYYSPGVHGALSRVEEIRETAGVAFGMASTAVFGGFLPFLYVHFGPRNGRRGPQYGWIQGLILTLFWTYKGLETDLFYRLQAHVVGTGHDAGTITLKVVLDQAVYSPLWAVPVTVAFYQALEAWPRWTGVWSDLRAPGWYRRRVMPVLIANAGVWVPAVAVIYALPTALQLPLQNIVLCFYTLIIAHQMRADAPAR
jgi:hypothetical protein